LMSGSSLIETSHYLVKYPIKAAMLCPRVCAQSQTTSFRLIGSKERTLVVANVKRQEDRKTGRQDFNRIWIK